MERGPRERLVEAAYACIARDGIARTSLEDVARAAGMSRATVYRHFAGGKDELVREVVAWEVRRFFARLAEAVAGAPGLATLLEEALAFAHREVEGHEVLQRVLATEPDRLLPPLTVESHNVVGSIRAFLTPYLASEHLRPGVDPGEAADYLARMLLSFTGTPGAWDLTDPAQVRRLAATVLLAGILPPAVLDTETRGGALSQG